jgi:hypothetical protein
MYIFLSLRVNDEIENNHTIIAVYIVCVYMVTCASLCMCACNMSVTLCAYILQ